MIKETSSFYVECDNCKETLVTFIEGFSLFVDQNQANNYAGENEWCKEGEKYYCPNCHKVDDGDNLIINAERKKD